MGRHLELAALRADAARSVPYRTSPSVEFTKTQTNSQQILGRTSMESTTKLPGCQHTTLRRDDTDRRTLLRLRHGNSAPIWTDNEADLPNAHASTHAEHTRPTRKRTSDVPYLHCDVPALYFAEVECDGGHDVLTPLPDARQWYCECVS